MRRKSLIIVLIVTAAISLAFVPVKSHAAVPLGWSDGNIVYAGPLFGKIIINVDAVNGSFANQWLELNPAMQNSLLATALSALSMQQPVRIWVAADPHVIAGITVQTCYSVLLFE
jgi:hypothetical protein